MKKSLVFILLIMLLIVLSCSAVFAEEGGSPRPQTTELTTDVLSDMSTYMKLSDPVALDKTQKYLAVANNTTLFVQPKENPNSSCYITLLNSDTPDDLITKVIVVEAGSNACKVVVLVKNTTTTQSRLIIVDVSDIKNPKRFDISDYTSIFNITKKDGNLAIVNNGNLILCDVSSNEIKQIQSYIMSVGTAKQETFKFIDNVGYILNADTYNLHKCELNGNMCNLTSAPPLQLGKNINDYYVSGESIYYIDPNFNLVLDGKPIELKDTIFKQLMIFDGNIVTTATTGDQDKKDNGKVYTFDKSGTEISQIASKGKDLYRLDSPQSVFSDGKFIYIADTNNNRIIKRNINDNHDRTAINVNEKPTKVVAINEDIYYLANGELFCTTNNKTAIKSAVKSMSAYNNLLLILSDNKVFAYDGNTLTEHIKSISITADEITTASQTNFAYLINKQSGMVAKYNLETLTTSAPQETIPQSTNYNIDFRGNLFVEKNGIITKFTQDNAVFKQQSQFSIAGVTESSKIYLSIDSKNGIYYFVNANDHLLFKINDENNQLGVMGTNNVLTPPTEFDILKAGKTNKGCNTYYTPDNPESAHDVAAGETFLILANASGQFSESYYYVISSKTFLPVYISKKDITPIEPQTTLSGHAMSPVVAGVQVFKYPYKTAELVKADGEPIILGKNDIVTCVHKIAAIDTEANEEIWNWYKIDFKVNGKSYTGYVGCNYLAKVTSPSHQTDIIFMKTKAPKIGTNIKIYAKASLDSEVLFDGVKDGIDIQIIGTYDPNSTFTQVFYNNTLGYILNENLQANGLTPNQIIAITITSVAVVAFIVLGILFMHKNKNAKNKLEKPSKDIV